MDDVVVMNHSAGIAYLYSFITHTRHRCSANGLHAARTRVCFSHFRCFIDRIFIDYIISFVRSSAIIVVHICILFFLPINNR